MPRVAGPLLVAVMTTAVVLRAAQDPAAPQAPVFRGGIETVAVYATVVDRAGELVVDLKREDFDVFDDGRRQNLNLFVSGLQPITAALLIDTSASMTLNLEQAQNAAEQFVIRMLPGDNVRVGSFSDRVDLSPDFTSDRDRLLKWVRNELHIGNPTKLWDAIGETMTALRPLGGRRVIMVLTDGLDTASRETAEALYQRARADELMIYFVQFRTTALGIQAEVSLSPSAGELFGSNPTNRGRAPGETLRRLAQQTGGGHFMLNQYDDVNATFTQVMQELHHQYVLGFTPDRPDGRVHELTVRVRRSGTFFVRARQSYQASRTASPTRE